MLERFSQLAEQAASNVSRRQFLRRFTQGAVISAGMLAAALGHSDRARAGIRCPAGTKRCRCRDGDVLCCPRGTTCRDSPRGYCTCS